MSISELATDEPHPKSLSEANSSDWIRFLVSSIFGLALYFGSAGIGLEMAVWQQDAPLIWPPAGLGLVLVLRGGPRYLGVVAAGALSIRMFEGSGAISGLWYAFAYTSATGLAAFLLWKVFKFQNTLERLVDVLAFIGVAVVIAPLISAGVTTISLCNGNAELCANRNMLFAVRWLSDALGILVIAPICLVWFSNTRINWRNTQAAEVLVWLMMLIALGAMIFRNWAPTDTLRYPLELSMFPLMAWAAIRFGQRGATTGILIVAMMAVWELRDVIGPDATSKISQPPGYLWLFVGVLSSTSLFLAAVLTEHRNREDQIRRNEERLRGFIQAMPDLAFVITEHGRYVEVFAPRESIFAERAELLVGKTLADIYPKELSKEFAEVIADVTATGKLKVFRYPMDFKGRRLWFEGRVAPMEPIENEPRSVIWVAYDITSSFLANEALRERDRLLQAVIEAEATLLKIQDFEAGIEKTLSIIGDGIDLDRIVVYENVTAPGKMQLKPVSRWARHTIYQGELGECHGIPSYEMEDAHMRLSRGLSASMYSMEEFPDTLRGQLTYNGKISSLWLPVIFGERFWGAIEFTIFRDSEGWDENSRAVLSSLAGSIGGFIETKSIEDALKEAKRLADAANSAKSEFLAMMSHEIRTPMNAILGFADLLAQTQLTEDQDDYLKIISRSGKDLLELINNILDFSKLESAPVELEETSFRIETTVMEVLEIMLMKAREKEVELTYEIEDSTEGVYLGDPLRFRQILLNLVSNAVKFTLEGSVRVLLNSEPIDRDRYRIMVSVKDTGIGIPQNRLDDLFKAFTQVDSSTTREFGGTGLGLTICKRLAEKMEGRIWVESSVGKGSTFHVEVILRTSPADEKTMVSSDTGEALPSDFAERFPLRILLAEDDPVNTRLAVEVLSRLGYRVDHAEDGAAASKLIEERDYDLAILDVQMAYSDGLEITRKVRAGEFGEEKTRLYVVALTAMALRDDEARCLEAGVNAFLAKPFSLQGLKDKLQEAYQSVSKDVE